jgi:hypothetical protein
MLFLKNFFTNMLRIYSSLFTFFLFFLFSQKMNFNIFEF